MNDVSSAASPNHELSQPIIRSHYQELLGIDESTYQIAVNSLLILASIGANFKELIVGAVVSFIACELTDRQDNFGHELVKKINQLNPTGKPINHKLAIIGTAGLAILTQSPFISGLLLLEAGADAAYDFRKAILEKLREESPQIALNFDDEDHISIEKAQIETEMAQDKQG